MSHVIALKLEPSARLPQLLHDIFDVFEGVPKDKIFHSFHVWFFPFVFPVLHFLSDWMNRKVHRAHVQRAHLRLCPQWICESLCKSHTRTATGSDINHRASLTSDFRDELIEKSWIW
ncbi:hypothetical protein D3C84_847700 [compost metagenome]